MGRRARRSKVTAHLGTSLLDSGWLARLARISFLGTLDEHPRCRRASNRLEHSIGVAALAADAADDLSLPPEVARCFVAAGLLHDVGHYPLSHAAEPAFAKLLGAGHHEVGRWIVLGDGPIPELRSLRPRLERIGIDPQQVWAVIDGSPDAGSALAPLAQLLRAPINLDTLEGIRRVARDFHLSRRGKLPHRIFTWVAGKGGRELGIERAALPAVDQFWLLKDRVYDQVINLPSNILAEARLCELVSAEIGPDVLGSLQTFDDGALRERLGEESLRRALLHGEDDSGYELWAQESYGEIVSSPGDGSDRRPVLVRTRKRYFVDQSVEPGIDGLPLVGWRARFRHERQRGWLVSRRQDQLTLPFPGEKRPAGLHREAPEI